MNIDSIVNLITLGGAMLLAVGYSLFVSLWLTPRIRPTVPKINSGALAAASALATSVAWLTATPKLYSVIAVFVPLLLASAWVDSKTQRIPNAYVVQGLALSMVVAAWLLLNPDTPPGWWPAAAWAAAGAGVIFVIFNLLNFFSGGGFGMGDVKLGAVMAFTLILIVAGTWSPAEVTTFAAPVMYALILIGWCTISFVLGGVYVLVRGLIKTKAHFPFGPCLVIAWFIVVALTPAIQILARQLVA